MKARTFRIDPRALTFDVLERAMIRDALQQYKTKRAAQAKQYSHDRYREAAEDDAARASDLIDIFNESLR